MPRHENQRHVTDYELTVAGLFVDRCVLPAFGLVFVMSAADIDPDTLLVGVAGTRVIPGSSWRYRLCATEWKPRNSDKWKKMNTGVECMTRYTALFVLGTSISADYCNIATRQNSSGVSDKVQLILFPKNAEFLDPLHSRTE